MNDNSRYHDISPEIHEDLAVWPRDVPFRRKLSLNFGQGDRLLLSSIETTLHLGAHTDAPNHYHPDGQGIGERDLRYYFGKCQVISIDLPKRSRIFPKDIENQKIIAPRVLFKTLSYPEPNQWNSDFNALSPELIHYLADQQVILVGIDTPSVDISDDSELVAHTAIFQRNLAILEGIILNHVSEGVYTLVALPLKIRDADASPVRAILIED